MAHSDFSTCAPDIAGTLRGLRVFAVDHSGNLRSLHYPHVWKAGENRARCLPVSLVRTKRTETREIAHEGWVNCECGFYAYTDGTNTYQVDCRDPLCPVSTHRQATGIIEVSGRMVIGPRGFRAEKARIRALVIPTRSDFSTLWVLTRRNYPDVPVFATEDEAVEAFPLTPTGGLL